MLRRFGLLAGMILGLIMLVGEASAQQVSVFTRKKPMQKHVYGIQIVGNGATYMMGDVNDYRSAPNHETVGNEDDALFGVGWGIGILYRSQERVRFSIGYNVLGEDKTYAQWTVGTIQEFEQSVNGGELYIQGEYIIPMNDRLSFSLGMGPAIYSGSLDRSGTVGVSFADASGRTLGFRGGVGAELLLGENYGLHFLGGFRLARIGEVSYEDRNGNEQIVYWGGNNRTIELDFTGVFVELGLRIYFEPATDWVRF